MSRSAFDIFFDDEEEQQQEMDFATPPPMPIDVASYSDECVCESWTIFNFGCKCGFIEREKRRKELDAFLQAEEERRKLNREKDNKKLEKLTKTIDNKYGSFVDVNNQLVKDYIRKISLKG